MTEKIIEIVTTVTGVTKDEIIKQNRKPKYADARKIAMHLCRDYTSLTLFELGVCFERDHTTVMHACEVSKDFIFVDPSFKRMFLQAQIEVEKIGLSKIERTSLKKAA